MFGQNSCFFCFAALIEHACKTFGTMVVKDTFMQKHKTEIKLHILKFYMPSKNITSN